MKDRILILGTEVTDDVANVLVAQMLYLASADPDADITLYINSPGGSVQAGLAIFDTMQVSHADILVYDIDTSLLIYILAYAFCSTSLVM
jgi:ATP-dependent Clp protease, protease subunit